ncbi:RDD family protein [Actinobacteria bacterium YIM 96077]|uniref:RDD domain-containing protein n=1 Tax=Phytoactinopolyspora halophila TaxID=1981511 RepID=A0A329QA56_9ACTN|nr:RDD family protein [Phytoactinopolyspora halophila]AYY14639.1 RDD family protein [Actinobacteria bacterium YIM 96077]RAW09203.1 hypothetical protein DPM12_22385 [Phytoactinopolyspora halophila]
MTVTPRLRVTGHYAGVISRAASAVLDVVIVLVSYTAIAAGIDMLARAITGESLLGELSGPAPLLALAVWAFLYTATGLTIAGRTPGKGIVGLRVVAADGSTLSGRRALWRTLALPVSALPAGLGFLGILVQREHRALHDLITNTAVVYDWGDRVAELPGPLSAFLARSAGAEYTARPPSTEQR